jgi:hypothetical protein
MRKIIFILFCFFCFSSLYSQSFHGGINFGFNISQVDGDNHGGYHKIAPAGGPYVRNTFSNPNWGASLAVLYKHKGSRYITRDAEDNVLSDYSIKLNYIELPLMFTYKFEKIGIPGLFEYTFNNEIQLEFGISYAYLVKGGEYYDNYIDPTTQFKKNEIANHIGLIYRLSNYWMLNYRFSYTFVFMPIHPHPGGQVYWFNRGMYNNNMNLSLIYEF